MAKKTISQSKTQYIRKGQKLSDGTVAKKGYVARKGNDLKKVTANVRLTATGDSANSKRLAGKKIGDVVKAQPSRGGDKNRNRNNTSNSTPPPASGLTAAQKTKMKKGAKASQAIAKGGMSKSQAAAAALQRGAKPAGAKSKTPGSEGPKGSDRQRVIAGARIDDVKVKKSSGSNASSWGKTRESSLSLPSFLKPGKNAPKMPKYTSSSTYKWKG